MKNRRPVYRVVIVVVGLVLIVFLGYKPYVPQSVTHTLFKELGILILITIMIVVLVFAFDLILRAKLNKPLSMEQITHLKDDPKRKSLIEWAIDHNDVCTSLNVEIQRKYYKIPSINKMIKFLGCLIILFMLLFVTTFIFGIYKKPNEKQIESASCRWIDKGITDFHSESSLETALNSKEDVVGKTVVFNIRDYKPDSAFGYNLISGEHLNFCSSNDPGVYSGNVPVIILSVRCFFNSYIIRYQLLEH